MIRQVLIWICFLTVYFLQAQEKKQVIIDADTGNEVDDLYAIVRALVQPSWNIVGINATQWQVSHWAIENSMEESYRLNNVLIAYLDQGEQIVSNRGAESRLFDWGNKSQTSRASQFITEQAAASENKINIIVLGALTNVASALLDQPSIAEKLRIYWLGTSFDFEKGLMKNTDFNSVMDIQAVDVILNSEVELHIMPNNVSSDMVLNWKETEQRLKGKHDLFDFLLQRWFNHLDGGRKERIIWDLALVEAIIHPEMAEEKVFKTSPEKGDREIWFYTDIDADRLREDFYQTILEQVESLD